MGMPGEKMARRMGGMTRLTAGFAIASATLLGGLALSEPPSGLRVVEVPVTRTDLRALAAEIAAAVAAALRGR